MQQHISICDFMQVRDSDKHKLGFAKINRNNNFPVHYYCTQSKSVQLTV
ncbi:MAG: hypothetical protein LBT09_11735 [Planctomycetaceae bacterium]|nr:hypothetical protein [Planctomycetaceae bacterium]